MKTLISVATLLLALTACSSDDSDSAKESPSPSSEAASSAPAETTTASSEPAETEEPEPAPEPEPAVDSCERVLVVGQVLPEDYDGCIDASGESLAALVYDDCDNGKTLYVLNDEGYGAYLGEEIVADSEALFNECYGY